jgi:hypothetical protein
LTCQPKPDSLKPSVKSARFRAKSVPFFREIRNKQLPQSALGSKSPLQAMKDWHKLRPELFKKQPFYLPGRDTYSRNAEK